MLSNVHIVFEALGYYKRVDFPVFLHSCRFGLYKKHLCSLIALINTT